MTWSWLFIYGALEWVIRLGMTPVVLRRRFAPVTALAWLSVIFFLPVLGLVLYLLIGENRLGRIRTRLHKAVTLSVRSHQRLAYLRDNVLQPEMSPALMPVILQTQKISGMPILDGNQVELLSETDQTIDRLIADIDAAGHHVHLLYYIFRFDDIGRRVTEALIRAAQRGVRCRLLVDAVGSRQMFGLRHRRVLGEIQGHGVEVQRALPASLLRRGLARLDVRNHRKLAVIDGRVAYTGSQNVVDADYGHRRAGQWLDLTGRFTGPVVGQLQEVFVEDWAFETDSALEEPEIFPALKPVGHTPAQAVPTGPAQESETLLRVILAAINTARRKIIITSPYLVPDEPTLLALSMAVDRGVEVNLVVPFRSDHPLVCAAGRDYFDPLLDAGVYLYQHQPGLLHAKTITIDDSFALLGSSNLDIRSFYLNFELNVLLYGQQVTQEIRFAQMRYLDEAIPVDRVLWGRRSQAQRYFDRAAALLSPLL